MVSLKLTVLLTVAAIVAFASSAVVDPSYNDDFSKNLVDDDKTEVVSTTTTTAPDFTDDEDDDDDTDDGKIDKLEIHGLQLKFLNDDDRQVAYNELDDEFTVETDWHVLEKIVKERKDEAQVGGPGSRQKRWVPIALRLLSAGRALFRGAVRAPKPTTSGSRITQQYTRPGTYNDAVNNFQRFKPDNVRSFNKNGISGQTGTVGNHRFTVRDGSKHGSPTLEIRSPRPNGEYVRKFRYEQK